MQKGLFRKHILHLFIIIAVGMLVYSDSLHVPFYFDDLSRIVNNPLIKDLDYFINPIIPQVPQGKEIYYDFVARIITYFTFCLNYAIHGLRVEGYHIVNIAIHIINALLVYWLVILTFRTPYFRTPNSELRTDLIALFSALFFISHPVQTQAVTYIVQRLTSLATMFYLLSLVLYIKWRFNQLESEVRSQKAEERQKFFSLKSCILYLASISSAVLAMKSKEIAFTLPLVIALYEFMFLKGNVRNRLKCLIPILLLMLIIPLSHLGSEESVEGLEDVARSVGGRGEVSRTDYLMTQFRVIVTYLRLLVLPVNQNLDYDYPVYNSFFDPNVFFSFLFLLSIIAFAVYLFRYSLFTIHYSRVAAFGIFWFFITLSVESSIIPLTLMFEHRVYLPSVGLFIAAVALLISMPARHTGRIIVLFSLVVAVFAGAGYARNQLWRDPLALWEDVVRKSPGIARPHNNLGIVYVQKGRYEEAIREFLTSINLKHDDAMALSNIGGLYVQLGRYEEAIKELQASLAIEPVSAEARLNLGMAYASIGALQKAQKEFQTALSIDPGFKEAQQAVKILQFQMGNAK